MISRWMSSVKVNTNNLKPPSSFNIGIVRVIFGRIYPPHKKWLKKGFRSESNSFDTFSCGNTCTEWMYVYIYIHVDMISYIKFLLTQDSKVFEEWGFGTCGESLFHQVPCCLHRIKDASGNETKGDVGPDGLPQNIHWVQGILISR